jgi:predicted ATP-grasp superfamily ATP-dependent carboligase
VSLYLAYHPKTRPTGRRLADAVGVVKRGTLVRKGGKVEQPDFLVRWGNGRYAEFDQPGRCINPAKAIWKAGDKLAALRAMQEAGVRVPEFYERCPGEGVILARKRRGFGGTDIQICGHNPCVPAEWYSRFVPNDREYRIHIVDGNLVRVVRKYLERPEQRRSEHIKNHSNGYVFKTPARKLNTSRVDASVKAVEALGLDFGAVDLVVDAQGVEYVLEVNTAPACSPKTLQAYAFQLANLIRERSNGDYILHPQVSQEALAAIVEDE